MRIVVRLVSTAIALAVAAQLIDGIYFSGPRHGSAEWHHKLVPLIVVAAILALITAFVKPVVTLLSLPLIIVTLGFFLLVINALLLKLAGSLSHAFHTGFHVVGFWPAVGGSIVITVVTWIVDLVLDDDDARKRRRSRPTSGSGRGPGR